MSNKRVAVVISHPIQHFCPQYASWSEILGQNLKVFFASSKSLTGYVDPGFKTIVKWGIRLNFNHEFLAGSEDIVPGGLIDNSDVERGLNEFLPDIVICYGYGQPLQRRVIKWAKNNKKKLAMISDSELNQKRSFLVRSLKALVLPRIIAKPDWLLTVGDANEQYYRRYGAIDKNFIRMSFPIDVEAFDQSINKKADLRETLRGDIGIKPGEIALLTVGKLTDIKRQLDIINAAKHILPRFEKIKIIIAGSGPNEGKLKSSANIYGDRVIFSGFLNPEDLIGYYRAADIYIHCAEKEPHSLAISEAIYAGLPVVISDRCGSVGPSDDVRHGLNGFVYTCGSVTELASYVVALAENDDLRMSMGAASRSIGLHHQKLAHDTSLRQLLTASGSSPDAW